MGMLTGGRAYFYIVNLQGDVTGIVDQTGNLVVSYTYDAWGNPLSTTLADGNAYAATVAALNPIRYRGYVYDAETGLYYLQSRYYNPEIGRFLNADAFTSTGQGFVGNNMFAYCNNSVVDAIDDGGMIPKELSGYSFNPLLYGGGGGSRGLDCIPAPPDSEKMAEFLQNKKQNSVIFSDLSLENLVTNDPETAAQAERFVIYKGVPIIKIKAMGNAGFTLGPVIFMGDNVDSGLVQHEHGHHLHYLQIGPLNYVVDVMIPSVTSYWFNDLSFSEYHSQPWERIADRLGGFEYDDYEPGANKKAVWYWLGTIFLP